MRLHFFVRVYIQCSIINVASSQVVEIRNDCAFCLAQ